MFPEAQPRETLRSRENETHRFPRDQLLSVLLYLPTQKKKKICEEIVYLTLPGTRISRGFKELVLITCESKVQVVVSLGSQ